ncbi:MAG: hypothetical protein MUP68_00380, partial [Deltaproteobacteria bacterium]|nr:hypothetical protein [Deltaproteobacteria bacterium]
FHEFGDPGPFPGEFLPLFGVPLNFGVGEELLQLLITILNFIQFLEHVCHYLGRRFSPMYAEKSFLKLIWTQISTDKRS